MPSHLSSSDHGRRRTPLFLLLGAVVLGLAGWWQTVHLWDVTDRHAPIRWAVLTGGDGPVVGLLFAGRPAHLCSVDPALADRAVCARAYPALTAEQEPLPWR